MNTRSVSMDIGKGILVLVMLLHHAWSAVYLSGDDSIRGVFSFVSSAFILFSGFLFGSYLLDIYLKSPASRWLRDMVRGTRLLSIYLSTNMLLYFIDYRGIGKMGFGEWLLSCIQPNPPEIVVFSLLNAFGYFFITASTIYIFTIYLAKLGDLNVRAMLFFVVSAIYIALALFYGVTAGSLLSSTTAYGFLGVILAMAVGRIPSDCDSRFLIVGSVSFIGYILIALLTFAGKLNPYTFYMPFVLLASSAVWRLAVWLEGRPNNVFIMLRFLGKYTLLAYMLQVVVAQLINLRMIDVYALTAGVWQAYLLSSTVMAFVMVALLLVVDRSRKMSDKFDAIYRMAIG